MFMPSRVALLAFGLFVAGLGSHAATASMPSRTAATPASHMRQNGGVQGKIQHIVIVVQEGRSFDNIFHGFAGADYAKSGKNSQGKTVRLKPISLADQLPPCNRSVDAVRDIDGGRMDGFEQCSTMGSKSYSYVEPSETAKYFALGEQYGISDRFFSSQLDGGYQGHQYLIAAYAGNTIDEPDGYPPGCDAPQGTVIFQRSKQVFPCFHYQTLARELDRAGLSWRYYAPGSGTTGYIWSAYDAIKYIREGPDWSRDVISPECTVLSDAAAGNLPNVSWVVPDVADSDDSGAHESTGPGWVTAVVNAVGQSPLWSSTAIFVTWSDWGGFYDHVVPPSVDWDGEGIRVPFIAISPYSKVGGISHGPGAGNIYEFSSILKSAEARFGLAPMSARDQNPNVASLWADSALFDFNQGPRQFRPFDDSGYICSGSQTPRR